jgi:hypothetical protein
MTGRDRAQAAVTLSCCLYNSVTPLSVAITVSKHVLHTSASGKTYGWNRNVKFRAFRLIFGTTTYQSELKWHDPLKTRITTAQRETLLYLRATRKSGRVKNTQLYFLPLCSDPLAVITHWETIGSVLFSESLQMLWSCYSLLLSKAQRWLLFSLQASQRDTNLRKMTSNGVLNLILRSWR